MTPKTYYAGFDLVDAADTSNVSYEHGGFGVSVPLLSGWEYKVEEYSADGMSYGVSFRPAGEDGWIDFQYWPTFGVCGTGLSMKEFGNGSMAPTMAVLSGTLSVTLPAKATLWQRPRV